MARHLRFLLATALLVWPALAPAAALQGKWPGICPPNGYKRPQPALDFDGDGDSTLDSWRVTLQLDDQGTPFTPRDAKKSVLSLLCVADPTGPGNGSDHYSPRFARQNDPVEGTEIGQCVYTCGANVWWVRTDQNVFTKSIWSSNEKMLAQGVCTAAWTGRATNFTTDLTKAQIAADVTRVPRSARTPCTVGIADATLVPLGTDPSTIVLNGAPVGFPAGEIDQFQYQADSTVINELFENALFAAPGDTISGSGTVTNIGPTSHVYTIETAGVNASGVTVVPSGSFSLAPGESAAYEVSGIVVSSGPAAITTYVWAETCLDTDNAANAVITLPPPDLPHFQCYELARQNVPTIAGVSLVDGYGATTSEVRRPTRLCNPADKNGEDPTAPNDPAHLVGYELRRTTPRFRRVRSVPVLNQFGTTFVDVVRPDRLLVPTAKSHVAPPPAPNPAGTEHLQCYKVSRARFRTDGVEVVDQFGSLTVDLKKPVRLCVPVDKNGEGVSDTRSSLLCYQERTSIRPRPGALFVANQFGPLTVEITRPTELCVPSLVPSLAP